MKNSDTEHDGVPTSGTLSAKSRRSSYAKKALSALSGGMFALAVNPASALNGDIDVLSCACQTTSQFSAAAVQESNYNGWGGSYMVVSSTVGSSALMQVHGKHLIDKNGNDYWLASSADPLDDAGNSLAGQSESAQESYYQTFDQTTFGVNRSAPTKVNEPPDYAGSFINSSEEEVIPGTGNALIHMGINPASIQPGTVITVVFEDGTTAQYVKVSNTATYQWTWNGIAHDKAGHRINRNGTLVSNPNTAGSGSGHAQVTGFGSGSRWGFGVAGAPTCTFITTITVNGAGTDYMYVHPC